MSTQIGNAIFFALLIILPVSALIARRMPLARTAMMALAWIGIFAIGLLAIAVINRNDWLVSGAHEMLYGRDQSVVGHEVRIPMSADGHFYAQAMLNGVERTLLIDSGATFTSLSTATADAAKVTIDPGAQPDVLETANGEIAGHPAHIATLKVGAITANDLRVVVAAEFGTVDVLGMNFLSKLKAWRVEGKTLILVPIAG